MRAAYTELKNGGVDGSAAADPERLRLVRALTNAEYRDKSAGKDLRGRELVSHLIELVLAWDDPERFNQTFPKCRMLLDRVVIEGGDV